jgi:hypothetical protein
VAAGTPSPTPEEAYLAGLPVAKQPVPFALVHYGLAYSGLVVHGIVAVLTFAWIPGLFFLPPTLVSGAVIVSTFILVPKLDTQLPKLWTWLWRLSHTSGVRWLRPSCLDWCMAEQKPSRGRDLMTLPGKDGWVKVRAMLSAALDRPEALKQTTFTISTKMFAQSEMDAFRAARLHVRAHDFIKLDGGARREVYFQPGPPEWGPSPIHWLADVSIALPCLNSDVAHNQLWFLLQLPRAFLNLDDATNTNHRRAGSTAQRGAAANKSAPERFRESHFTLFGVSVQNRMHSTWGKREDGEYSDAGFFPLAVGLQRSHSTCTRHAIRALFSLCRVCPVRAAGGLSALLARHHPRPLHLLCVAGSRSLDLCSAL